MNKILLFVVIMFTLTACGQKVHENISEEVAADTEQIISITDKLSEENRDLSERERKVFDQYLMKYEIARNELDSLNEEEYRVSRLTEHLIEGYEMYTTLAGDKEDYEASKERIYRVMETGSIQIQP